MSAGPQVGAQERLPRAMRLRSKREIDTVFRAGRYHRLGLLQAKTLPNDHGHPRFMVSVRRSCGTAPERNRIKRVVREAVRLNRHRLPQAHDVCLFVTRPPRRPVALATIEPEVRRLFERLTRNAQEPSP